MSKTSWFKTTLVAGAAALGIVGVGASSASALIACNRFGECWHVHHRWVYPAEAGIVFHKEGWRFAHRGWRWVGDRDDRGYWFRGAWRVF